MNTQPTRWTNNEWYLNTTGTNEKNQKEFILAIDTFFLEANEI
jgi:hypothetical protein